MIGGLMFDASVLSGFLGAKSARKNAKKQARETEKTLNIQYAFNLNDAERELMYNKEQLFLNKLSQELDFQKSFSELALGLSGQGFGGATVAAFERDLNTQKVYQELNIKTQLDNQMYEFDLFKNNQKLLRDREIQNAWSQVPSKSSYLKGALSGALKGYSFL